MAIDRRKLMVAGIAGSAALAVPSLLSAQAKPRVIIVGGGAGGATAARTLAALSDGALDIILVEEMKTYTSCFYSNIYLGGLRDFSSITHTYDRLIADYGIKQINDRAVSVDREGQTVVLGGGKALSYDRLVLAPGIDFVWDSVPGYSQKDIKTAPHAWQGGWQTSLLRSKLEQLENGQNIVVVAPPNPYRCPPGPYERVSLMAHVLKSKGFSQSRIIIIDPKPGFSKQALFTQGWQKHYPGMIEWYGPDVHGGLVKIDAKAGRVETDIDTFEGDLLNIIPAQRAGAIASENGLADDTGFCPVQAESMRSTLDANIFVIGDASRAGAMPKSAFSANSQAKVASAEILKDLLRRKAPTANYANTCWSLISPGNSVKVGADYVAKDGEIVSISSFISDVSDEAETRRENYAQSAAWYDGISVDMFG